MGNHKKDKELEKLLKKSLSLEEKVNFLLKELNTLEDSIEGAFLFKEILEGVKLSRAFLESLYSEIGDSKHGVKVEFLKVLTIWVEKLSLLIEQFTHPNTPLPSHSLKLGDGILEVKKFIKEQVNTISALISSFKEVYNSSPTFLRKKIAELLKELDKQLNDWVALYLKTEKEIMELAFRKKQLELKEREVKVKEETLKLLKEKNDQLFFKTLKQLELKEKELRLKEEKQRETLTLQKKRLELYEKINWEKLQALEGGDAPILSVDEVLRLAEFWEKVREKEEKKIEKEFGKQKEIPKINKDLEN